MASRAENYKLLSEIPDRIHPNNARGRKERLYTNHFKCSVADNIPLYEYIIRVEEINSRDSSCIVCENKIQYFKVIRSIVQNYQLDPNIFVWYNEYNRLYSTSVLATPRTITHNNYQLIVESMSKTSSTTEINEYISGHTRNFPYDAVDMIDVLLKNSFEHQVKFFRNKFYFTQNDYETSDVAFEQQYGLKQRYGFIQELNISPNILTLNVETTPTTFFSNISLLDFIHIQTPGREMPTDLDYKKLTLSLMNCILKADATLYKFVKFDYRRPYELVLESGELLIDYYQTRNIVLEHTNYPCIEVKLKHNGNIISYLPLEICYITDWQICEHLPFFPKNEKLIPTPSERYQQIINTLWKCGYNNNLLCQTVGFRIDDHEMLSFQARILSFPIIKLGVNHQAHIDDGQIQLGGQFYIPKEISKLAITYFGTNFSKQMKTFETITDRLVNHMGEYDIYCGHEEHIVKADSESITRYFHNLSEQNFTFVICLMDTLSDDECSQLKINIKKCGTMKYGISADINSIESYCDGIARKLNFKNGGINTNVILDNALMSKKSENDFYMFLGAVIIHERDPINEFSSIAGIVGSGNSSCSTTAARVSKQCSKFMEGFSKTIAGMEEMVQQLLYYYLKLNKHLPNKIVLYRDKIDKNDFADVLRHEVPEIQRAFFNVYGIKSHHPRLTIIAVNRRHSTRFFTDHNETENMSIGCVVDTTIVHPYQHDFYMNSHNIIRGVNHPSRYHLLLDEIGFTSEQLELLTYHLCYTDPRSPSCEAVPSVVHQANIAVSNAKDLFSSENNSYTSYSRNNENPLMDYPPYKILEVHEKLKNMPALV